MENFSKKQRLAEIIKKYSLPTDRTHKIINPNGTEAAWLFDIKNILLEPEPMNLMADLFWEKFEGNYPFQVGGQEFASVPLLSAIISRGLEKNKPVSGFVIRKSRKPLGLQKIIEGQLKDQKIILVDDILNSGSTMQKQIKILEGQGKKVNALFSVVNFRGKTTIDFFQSKGIRLDPLFSLDDFGLKMEKNYPLLEEKFDVKWIFSCPDPSYQHRVPKSTPCLDENRLYFGADHGFFYALNQKDGSVFWKFKVGSPVSGKSIFSCPLVHKDKVYFGSYDGTVYALDKTTGKIRWRYLDADYVGSSPAIAPELNLLFIGLEFGLFRKKGGIAALDLNTGKKAWDYHTENFVHSTPAYCPQKSLVVVGCNNGYVYAFDAKGGQLRWKYKTGGPVKASFDFDLSRNQVFFGSFDEKIYALDLDTGQKKGEYKTESLIYSTPKVYGESVYFSSMDKNLYCLDIANGNLRWKFKTNGRIFSSPEIIGDSVFFGSNDGKMYEVNRNSGQMISFFQTLERITNKIVYNSETQRFFVSTYANEIYCLEKKPFGELKDN